MLKANYDTGDIQMYGVIGDFEDGVSHLDVLDILSEMGGKDVRIHLQSEGGDVMSGLSIFNQFEAYQGNITIDIDAMAASIASVFPMAADKITLARNSTFMIHNAWTIALGNARDFKHTAEVLEKLDGDIAQAYADRTGRPKSFWMDEMAREPYYSAEEAVGLGLADEIRNAENKGKTKKAAAKAFAPVALSRAKGVAREIRRRYKHIEEGRR